MKNLIITDNNDYTNSEVSILYIDKYSKNLKDFSVLNFIEDNSQLIKKEFKKDLKKISNFILNDNFINNNSFNFIYNFFLFDRSLYKYPSINEYIKIIALKKFLYSKKNKFCINLKISNKKKKDCLEKILKDLNIEFKNNYFSKNKDILNLNFFNQYLLIGKFILRRLFLKKSRNKVSSKKNFIIGYLAYINKKKLYKGKLETIYWGNVFKDKKDNFFLYIYNENVKNDIQKICQIQNNKNSNFLVLDTILNIKDFFLIIFLWIKVAFFFNKKKKSLYNYFNSLNKSYEIFNQDIYNSLFGFDCFMNVYYSYLFNKLSKKKFKSKKIFYTHENQGWEKSLNFYLKNKTKKIYAVIGTPVRYWDTRYLQESNFFSEKNKKKYLPDFYAVNGKISKKNLLNNDFKKEKIVQVEAARYNFKEKLKTHKKLTKNFLVAGDYNHEVNIQLENLVIKLSKVFKKDVFYIKQHPNLKFGDKLRKIKNCLFVDNKSISELSDICGKAIIPNMTSASIDAIMNDLKTLVMYTDGQINFSPLKNVKEILHEKDEKMIINYFNNKLEQKINKNYFLNLNLNNKLWKKII